MTDVCHNWIELYKQYKKFMKFNINVKHSRTWSTGSSFISTFSSVCLILAQFSATVAHFKKQEQFPHIIYEVKCTLQSRYNNVSKTKWDTFCQNVVKESIGCDLSFLFNWIFHFNNCKWQKVRRLQLISKYIFCAIHEL